jgi:uncharacterized membrane protein YfcA
VAAGSPSWLFVVSLAASALGGMLGMASGIFLVPILIMFGGISVHEAVGASLVSVIACSCGSAAPFLKGRLTNIRLAVVLEVATTAGALCGFLISGILAIPVLYAIFAVVLFVSALQMFRRRQSAAVEPEDADDTTWIGRLDSSYPDDRHGRDVRYSVERLGLGFALMYGAGLLSALLGIGSGVLKIPAMDAALRLPLKVSSATSNFMIGVTGAASAGAYFMRGDIVAPVVGPVVIGSVIGAILGAKLLMVLPAQKLRLLFVAVLLALAIQMLLASMGIQITPPGG